MTPQNNQPADSSKFVKFTTRHSTDVVVELQILQQENAELRRQLEEAKQDIKQAEAEASHSWAHLKTERHRVAEAEIWIRDNKSKLQACEKQLEESKNYYNTLLEDVVEKIRSSSIQEEKLQAAEQRATRSEAANIELRSFINEYARHNEGCSASINDKYTCKCGYDRELEALDMTGGSAIEKRLDLMEFALVQTQKCHLCNSDVHSCPCRFHREEALKQSGDGLLEKKLKAANEMAQAIDGYLNHTSGQAIESMRECLKAFREAGGV